MSQPNINDLIRRFQADPTFRDALRADAEGTARRAGFALGADEWEALRSFDWNASDQRLASRVSAMLIC